MIEQTPILITRSGKIECQALLRNLPGRRKVFRGLLEGRQIVVKCFVGHKTGKDYRRELRGVKSLLCSGINTANLCYHGKARFEGERRVFKVVVTEFIENATSFEALWKQSLSDNQRLIWLYRVVRLLGCLYRVGITPVDIHLDNLLVRHQDLYLVDGGGVSASGGWFGPGRPLSRKKALKNFTLFMSVLAPRHEIFIQKLYLALVNFIPVYSGVDIHTLIAMTHRWRKWRERYLEKTLRTCSDFIMEKGCGWFQVINRHRDSEALRSLLESIQQKKEKGEQIKQGRTNTVTKVLMDNGSLVVVKRYHSTKRFSFFRKLKKSRARRSWQGAWLLKMLDIDTPEPLAMFERKYGPFVVESYIITEYIPGTGLSGYFNLAQWPANWKSVTGRIQDCLTSLERSRVYHGDLKATNFIVYHDHVFLIDLDSLVSCRTENQYRPLWKKDCERFMKNWHNRPEVAELFLSGN